MGGEDLTPAGVFPGASRPRVEWRLHCSGHARADSRSLVVLSGGARPEVGPSTLMLKSISGSGKNRFAMINNTTFETMEKARVRLGQTNVVVRCLEIRNDSVTIQVEGSAEKQQLFLKSAQ